MGCGLLSPALDHRLEVQEKHLMDIITLALFSFGEEHIKWNPLADISMIIDFLHFRNTLHTVNNYVLRIC